MEGQAEGERVDLDIDDAVVSRYSRCSPAAPAYSTSAPASPDGDGVRVPASPGTPDMCRASTRSR
ncbi:hypothetical protein YW7DRAFT_00055 [Streptomyces sp. AmelKG-E11A]|nr:hypothetical protein YW7DRAFT_00055 [Streptomyces sp. AmelKG-E11A]